MLLSCPVPSHLKALAPGVGSRARPILQDKCHGDEQIIDARGQSSVRMENPDEDQKKKKTEKEYHVHLGSKLLKLYCNSSQMCLLPVSTGEHGDRYTGV